MPRIEILKNKGQDWLGKSLEQRTEIADIPEIKGVHQTIIGELNIEETVSPDGRQPALILKGEAMRGHGKHVMRDERMVQISGWRASIQLERNKWISIDLCGQEK